METILVLKGQIASLALRNAVAAGCMGWVVLFLADHCVYTPYVFVLFFVFDCANRLSHHSIASHRLSRITSHWNMRSPPPPDSLVLHRRSRITSAWDARPRIPDAHMHHYSKKNTHASPLTLPWRVTSPSLSSSFFFLLGDFYSELFLEKFAAQAFDHAEKRGRRLIKYQDVSDVRVQDNNLLFLEAVVPP